MALAVNFAFGVILLSMVIVRALDIAINTLNVTVHSTETPVKIEVNEAKTSTKLQIHKYTEAMSKLLSMAIAHEIKDKELEPEVESSNTREYDQLPVVYTPKRMFHRLGVLLPRFGKLLKSFLSDKIKDIAGPKSLDDEELSYSVPNVEPCIHAVLCLHDRKEICGVQERSIAFPKRFLDLCDMYEYNCERRKDYIETDLEDCNELPPISENDCE